jgi:hypothetical protein
MPRLGSTSHGQYDIDDSCTLLRNSTETDRAARRPSMKTFFTIFLAILAAAAVIFGGLAAKSRLDNWNKAKNACGSVEKLPDYALGVGHKGPKPRHCSWGCRRPQPLETIVSTFCAPLLGLCNGPSRPWSQW